MTDVLVLIPCRDEGASVASVVEGFRKELPDARILVVDNGSRDDTGERAARAGAQILRVPEGGKGAAVRAGLAQARKGELLLLVDGDGAFAPEDASALLAPIRRGAADLVVGNRFALPWGAGTLRRGLNRGLNALVRGLFGSSQHDLLSGYRALAPAFWSALDLRTTGFEIEMELGLAAIAGGYRLREVPVTVRPRTGGSSKIRVGRDGFRLLYFLLRWVASSSHPDPVGQHDVGGEGSEAQHRRHSPKGPR